MCFVEVGFAQHFKNQVYDKAKQNPHMPLKVCKYAFCAFPSLRSMLVQKCPYSALSQRASWNVSLT